jgi:hypothetical protein
LQQAIVCGAHPVATNGLRAVTGRWRYFVDKDGMVMQLPREQFSEVQSFLLQTFGSPEQEPIDLKSGGKLGWYAAKTIGVAIQFGYDSKHTQITVLRAQPMSKVFEIITDAPQEKK